MKSDDFKKDTRSPVEIARTILQMPAMHMIEGQTFSDYLEMNAAIQGIIGSRSIYAKNRMEPSPGDHKVLLEALNSVVRGEDDMETRNILEQAPRLLGIWITQEKDAMRTNAPKPSIPENPIGSFGPKFAQNLSISRRESATTRYENSQQRIPQLEAIQSELIALNKAMGIGRKR